MTLWGLDISHYQSGLDLSSAREQGYSFVMAKVTEGTGFVDNKYAAFRDAAKREGLLFAAYHYLRSDSSPTRQAQFCASKLGDKSIPVMLDMETGSNASRPQWSHAAEFMRALLNAGARTTLLYLPEWYWSSIGSPKLPAFPLLISSKYGKNPSGYASSIYPGDSSERWSGYGGRTPVILQFGSRGKYSGYSGDVDVNAFRGTIEELKKLNIFKDWSRSVADASKPMTDSTFRSVWETDAIRNPYDDAEKNPYVYAGNLLTAIAADVRAIKADVAAIKKKVGA